MEAEPVTASVFVEAEPDEVYAYFTEAEAMIRWMGEYAMLDARPDGAFTMDIEGTPVRGRYRELDPPNRVVFTWGFAGSDELPPGSSTVEVRFSREASGTRVELVHRGLPPSKTATHAAGWRRFLDRLALAGNTSGVDSPPSVEVGQMSAIPDPIEHRMRASRTMDLGVHLPVLQWSESEPETPSLIAYVETARRLGFTAVSVNDHVQHRRPWLDGPTALASVVSATGDMTLATTIALAVVRGPIALAKSLGAIDLLSGGRLVVGVGPGSYAPDYEAAGLAWDERWPRFEEAIGALRALWHPDGEPFEGTFYSTRGIRLEPAPAQDGGPPIWVGSWGSDAGLRRVARLGDGWVASAYNTTPEDFAGSWDRLRRQLPLHGKDPETFPNALATMFFRVEDDPARVRRVLEEWVAPTLGRAPQELGERLLVAPAEACAERLSRYAEAGVQRLFLWPVGDPIEQLELFGERVAPKLDPV